MISYKMVQSKISHIKEVIISVLIYKIEIWYQIHEGLSTFFGRCYI